MCQGASCSQDDVSICSPQLRCPDYYGLIKKVTMNQTGHSYCHDTEDTDSVYDRIDRADVTFEGTATVSINYTQLTPCYDRFGNPGLQCGEGEDNCLWSVDWCRNDKRKHCGTFWSDDPTLCSNTNFWKNVTCTVYQYGEVETDGKRCSGQQQHCYYPWYTWYDGVPYYGYKQTCDDKSDQVFPLNTKCSDIARQHLQDHNDRFCNDARVKDKEICTSPQQWLQKRQQRKKTKYHDPQWYIDPHNCQASCAEADPSPDCLSCQNKLYYKCEKSQQCVHPDLVCDGHPQCEQAEDEDFTLCTTDKYISRFKAPSATLPCLSKMYQGKNHYIATSYC